MSTKRPPIPEGMLELDVLEIGGQKVNLNNYFTNEYTDISEAAAELPNLIEWVNGQLQVLFEDKLNCEQQLKKAEAAAYFDLRGGTFMQVYGSKKAPSEKALDHAVILDEEVQRCWTTLNSLTAWCRRLHNLQTSLQTKLDLIRSSEATRRRLVEPAELELDRTSRRNRENDDGQ